MFEISKDTKVLIFSTQRDTWLSTDDVKRMEVNLTERTGIPCVVLTGLYTLLIPNAAEIRENRLHEEPKKAAPSWPQNLSTVLAVAAIVLSLIVLIAQLRR